MIDGHYMVVSVNCRIMEAQGNNTGKKQSRSQRRRDTENSVFEELADLLPVSQDIKQDKLSILRLTVAYLKLKDGLETDEQDLEECLANVHDGPAFIDYESELPPLAMLDNDGNLVAGTLHRNPTIKGPTIITVPDQVMSELEEQFLSSSEKEDDAEANERMEKLQKYKEGLEKGMQEFLSQDLSDFCNDYNNSSSVRGILREREQKKSQKSCKGAREDNAVTKTPNSSVISKKTDHFITVAEPVLENNWMLEAATGFILTLDKDKRILFVSENVVEFLGHCQSFLIGQEVSEFIYEKDYPELDSQMSDKQFQQEGTGRRPIWMLRRTFYMAMKFCFQQSGSRMKDCGYQLYQWNAKLRLYKDSTSGDIHVKGLTALCCPLQRDTISSVDDNANSFMMRFSIKDARILYCDPKIQDLLGYNPSDLVGLRHSDLKHPCDTVMCRYNYRKLPQEGSCESGYYRLLSRMGTWVWLYSNFNIIYDRHGVPEVLVVRNVIVSQAEAHCVLSREREDFEKIKLDGYSEDFFIQKMGGATLASITFDKKRKKRRTSLNVLPSDVVGSRVKSTSAGSSKKTLAKCMKNMPKKTLNQEHVQKSNTSLHPQPQKSYPSGPERIMGLKMAIKATASKAAKKVKKSERLLDSPAVEKEPDKIMQQTLIEHSMSEDIIADTYQSTDSSSSVAQSRDPLVNLTDSESSLEMPFSQQMINDLSSITSSSSPFQFSSFEQEWSIDSLLFDDDLEDNRSYPSSSRSETSISSSTCPSSRQINLDERDMDFAKFNNNDQIIEIGNNFANQGNTECPLRSQTSASADFSVQSSDLVMSLDRNLGGVLDFLTEEISPASNALMTPSSGDVMLSILTAPQPITSTQNQALKTPLNTTGFQNVASETKYNNKSCLPGNLTGNVKAIVSSYETLNKRITSDKILSRNNFTFYESLCDPPPVVSGQTEIFYSPGKLDYPPLQSMSRYPHEIIGDFHDHFQHAQKRTSNPIKNTSHVLTLGSSFQQNDHNNYELIKDGLASEHFSPEKILLGSACQNEYAPSVHNLRFATADRDKQSLISTSKAKTGISSPARSIVPGFCEELGKDISHSDTDLTSANEINKDIMDMRSKDSSASSNSLENVTSFKEPVTIAVKLPEDLADLEIDCDIAVSLSDNWMKYL